MVLVLVLVLVLLLVGLWSGAWGVFLTQAKIRPRDTMRSNCDHTSNSALQTNDPSPNQLPLDRPADLNTVCIYIRSAVACAYSLYSVDTSIDI